MDVGVRQQRRVGRFFGFPVPDAGSPSLRQRRRLHRPCPPPRATGIRGGLPDDEHAYLRALRADALRRSHAWPADGGEDTHVGRRSVRHGGRRCRVGDVHRRCGRYGNRPFESHGRALLSRDEPDAFRFRRRWTHRGVHGSRTGRVDAFRHTILPGWNHQLCIGRAARWGKDLRRHAHGWCAHHPDGRWQRHTERDECPARRRQHSIHCGDELGVASSSRPAVGFVRRRAAPDESDCPSHRNACGGCGNVRCFRNARRYGASSVPSRRRRGVRTRARDGRGVGGIGRDNLGRTG